MERVDWTTGEEDALRRYYPEHGPSWDGWGKMLPRRSRNSISQHACKLGVKCLYRGPKSWTKAQDRMAVAMLVEVCKETHRSPDAVISRLRWLVRKGKTGRTSW